jgi:endonuclease I
MKTYLLSSLFLLSNFIYCQIPTGYYDNTSGIYGEQLKTNLNEIIKGHTQFSYSSSNTDVWDILKQTDKDPNDSNNIILFYTGWSVNAAQEYNNGSGWNREHIWSKSHGDFGTTQGAGTDIHHLRPSDISVNSAKSSRWFDNCSTPYLDNGVHTGCFTSSENWVWQPRDEVKGDVARMIFYMATRYEGDTGEPDLELIDYFPSENHTSDAVYAKVSTLLQWHNSDPVDDRERNRNNIIYSDFQNNRNPFIDHPEFANLIWSNVVSLDVIKKKTLLNMYPNPVKNTFTIDLENKITHLEVTDLYGKKVYEEDSLTVTKVIDLEGLNTGIYIVKVSTEQEVISARILKD